MARDIPQLEGWLSVTATAEILGISRQGVWKLVDKKGEFPGARKAGDGTGVLLLPEWEVRALCDRRKVQFSEVDQILDGLDRTPSPSPRELQLEEEIKRLQAERHRLSVEALRHAQERRLGHSPNSR